MMELKRYSIIFFLFVFTITWAQEEKTYNVITIAFYNLENLFDFKDDPLTFDDARTPNGKDHWTEEDYRAKVKNMAEVISEIGKDLTQTPPTIVGVCEIENRQVLEDITNEKVLARNEYGIIHFDSPDRRGIDVGLLYQKKMFTPTNYKAYPLYIYDNNDVSKRVYTRDQLLVSGILDGEKIHIIVNHWPSRSGGEFRSRYKRIKAAELNKRLIDSIFSEDPYAKIINMGDLNDDPINTSIKEVLNTKADRDKLKIKDLFNPMEKMYKSGLGSLAWRDAWNLFDQTILSSELLKKDYSSYRYYKAGIFNKLFLTNSSGQYKGYPYRSFDKGAFTGGYSDHYPVYVHLIKERTTKRHGQQ